MPQTTLDGKELLEDEFWAEGSFIESRNNEDWELKKRTFHMKHNEEINYNCKQCSTKTLGKANFSSVPKMHTFLSISAHNKDWHAGMCDKCFNKLTEVD